MALRREKNIYTLKPKNLEETAIAADHLKTGSAVVLNLDDVDRLLATRIIDFMSGVCYGLESQGHAMKLGRYDLSLHTRRVRDFQRRD
jgi:cell division inhibitor SepF